jgi:trans-2,3-dihydro-3-hydroxyanthranilate isomerase
MHCFPVVQVDVFTKNRLEGNALAVVTDATGLTDEEMQALAKETNLSETTFVFPRDAATEKARGVRVRIYTVAEELPFAGHPTLGTAFVLRGTSGAPEILLDLNVGSVPVRYEDTLGQPSFGEMRQRDPEFGATHDAETIARVTGLALNDIDTSVPIQSVSTGLSYTIVAIKSLETLQNLRIDLHAGSEYLQKSGGKFFYFVSRETVSPAARLHARMLFYNGEDPATGSAGGCAAAWMAAHGVAAPNERVLIEQGLEMKRPSEIFVRANREGDAVNNVRVGGNCVEVMRGEIIL